MANSRCLDQIEVLSSYHCSLIKMASVCYASLRAMRTFRETRTLQHKGRLRYADFSLECGIGPGLFPILACILMAKCMLRQVPAGLKVMKEIILSLDWKSEFLKAAIMQSHDCAKYLRICENLSLMNVNQEKLAQMLYIFNNLTMFSSFTCFIMSFVTHVSAQDFQSEHFDCAT